MVSNLGTTGLVVVVLLALTLSAFTAYTYLGSTPMFFLSATGQSPMDSTRKVTITGFSGESCTVSFEAQGGVTLEQTYTPCKFTFSPQQTNSPPRSSRQTSNIHPMRYWELEIQSVDRGLLKANMPSRGAVLLTSSTAPWVYEHRPEFGWQVVDYPGDDISWSLQYTEVGEGGVETNKIQALGDTYACIWKTSHTGLRSSSTVADIRCISKISTTTHKIGRVNYWSVFESDYTRMVDSSRTFQVDVDNHGRVTFEIINPNFYISEEYARDTIISAPHFRDIDCPIKPGYMVAVEEFAAGSNIHLTSFRYPVNYFCSNMPVTILDVAGRQIDAKTQPLKDILDGETIRVPDDNVWQIMYVIRVTSDVPIICTPEAVPRLDSGECPGWTTESIDGICYAQTVLDMNEGCVIKPGIIHFCREGIWDPDTYACVVQPDTNLICPSGTTYDAGLDKCIYIPPKQAECPDDSIYDPDLDKCVYEPTRLAVCPEGSYYDESMDMCRYTPDFEYYCVSRYDDFGNEYTPKPFVEDDVGWCPYKCSVPLTLSFNRFLSFLNMYSGYVHADDCSKLGELCYWDGTIVVGGGPNRAIPITETEGKITGTCKQENSTWYCESYHGSRSDWTPTDYPPDHTHREICPEPAKILYDPCEEGFIESDVGVCVRVPEYDHTIRCKEGYTLVGNICLMDKLDGISCPPGYYYDSSRKECGRIMPSEYYCTQEGGTYLDGVCFVKTTLSHMECPDGFTWDGSKCVGPKLEHEILGCDEGFVYNPITNKCEQPSVIVVPPEDETNQYLIALALAIIVFIAVFGLFTGLFFSWLRGGGI